MVLSGGKTSGGGNESTSTVKEYERRRRTDFQFDAADGLLDGPRLDLGADAFDRSAQMVEDAVSGARLSEGMNLVDQVSLIGGDVLCKVRHLRRHDDAEYGDRAKRRHDGEKNSGDLWNRALAKERDDRGQRERKEKRQREGNDRRSINLLP
ncbi:hypothetical protein [Rhizobium ruizarguesonis]